MSNYLLMLLFACLLLVGFAGVSEFQIQEVESIGHFSLTTLFTLITVAAAALGFVSRTEYRLRSLEIEIRKKADEESMDRYFNFLQQSLKEILSRVDRIDDFLRRGGEG